MAREDLVFYLKFCAEERSAWYNTRHTSVTTHDTRLAQHTTSNNGNQRESSTGLASTVSEMKLTHDCRRIYARCSDNEIATTIVLLRNNVRMRQESSWPLFCSQRSRKNCSKIFIYRIKLPWQPTVCCVTNHTLCKQAPFRKETQSDRFANREGALFFGVQPPL